MREEADWTDQFGVTVETVADGARFAEYVDQVVAARLPDTPRPDNYVPCTTLWWVQGEEFLGRLSIRHRLNGQLRRVGGHVGYWIRPSARGQGHGRAAFAASLPMAHALGIDPALVTCDHDNVASRRIIEGAGGQFERQLGKKRLYWVATRP